MDEQLECPADGSFEFGEEDGYVDEPDGGTVGVDVEAPVVYLNVEVEDVETSVHARAELDPEQAREVADWLTAYADSVEE